MAEHLGSVWPDDAPLSKSQTLAWIFDDPVINRIGIVDMKKLFFDCDMEIAWMLPIGDENRDERQLELARAATGLSEEDLMIRGLSVLLRHH